MKKISAIILSLLISSTAFAAVVNWGGNTFTGLSSDTKPAASNGSRFYETNTLIPWLRVGGSWSHFALSLSDIGNPTADKTFNMATRSIQFTFTNPSNGPAFDGAFEIEATGAFTGDLLHVHQHNGNPGPGTDLVHLESDDADITTLNIISGPSSTSIVADKKIIAGGFSTGGTVTAGSAVVTTATATFFRGGLYGPCTDHTAHSIYSSSSSTGLAWASFPTGEMTLMTCTIPGGSMGPKGTFEGKELYTVTNSSNNKAVRTYYGGVLVNRMTTLTTIASSRRITYFLNNNGSESSQLIAPLDQVTFNSTGGSSYTPASINTAIDQPLTITGQTTLETGAAVTSGTGNGAICTANLVGHGLNTGEYIQAAGGSNCSTSGNPNGDPVQITRITADQFTYPCTCNGNMVATFPTQKRYSVIRLESIDTEIKRPAY